MWYIVFSQLSCLSLQLQFVLWVIIVLKVSSSSEVINLPYWLLCVFTLTTNGIFSNWRWSMTPAVFKTFCCPQQHCSKSVVVVYSKSRTGLLYYCITGFCIAKWPRAQFQCKLKNESVTHFFMYRWPWNHNTVFKWTMKCKIGTATSSTHWYIGWPCKHSV